MGATGILIGGNVQLEPLAGRLTDWENAVRRGDVDSTIEHGALYGANGEAIVGYMGDQHSVNIDDRVLQTPGAIFTHIHPDNNFGGSLSMQDIDVFAHSQLSEVRAISKQGQLYSIRATENIDREGLGKWVKANKKLMQRNFDRSMKSALKTATTPLKSGPHKGQIKLTDPRTGKVTYRQPMTQQQAARYARQYSVGMFERMYKKNLAQFGVIYTSTKAGKNNA